MNSPKVIQHEINKYFCKQEYDVFKDTFCGKLPDNFLLASIFWDFFVKQLNYENLTFKENQNDVYKEELTMIQEETKSHMITRRVPKSY